MCRSLPDAQTNQAVNGVISSCDALADMLESIEHFLHRLRMYTVAYHSTPVVDGVVVKLIVELISTLALVTRKLKKRRSRESFLASLLPHSSHRSQMCEKFLWC